MSISDEMHFLPLHDMQHSVEGSDGSGVDEDVEMISSDETHENEVFNVSVCSSAWLRQSNQKFTEVVRLNVHE